MDPKETDDELSVEEHIRRENAIEAGLTPKDEPAKPATPAAKSNADAVGEPDAVPAVPSAAAGKRTAAGKKQSIQSEIDSLTAQKHTSASELKDTQDRITAARAELADLETRRAAKPAGEPDVKPAAAAAAAAAGQTTIKEWERFKAMPDAPQLGEFEDFSDWNIAMNLFIADKRFDERLEAHEAHTADLARGSAWQGRFKAAIAANPDLQTKIDPKTPATEQMRNFVIAASERHAGKTGARDIGVEILVYLSAHQAEAQRIATLHPLDVAEEMARIETRLEAANSGPAQAPPVISSAKPLIKPVSGSPILSDDVDPDTLSVEEHIRRENQREFGAAHH